MEWKNRNREQETPKKSLVIGEQMGPSLAQLGFGILPLPLIEPQEETPPISPISVPPPQIQTLEEIAPNFSPPILTPEVIPLPDFTSSPSEQVDYSMLEQVDQTLKSFVRPEKVDFPRQKSAPNTPPPSESPVLSATLLPNLNEISAPEERPLTPEENFDDSNAVSFSEWSLQPVSPPELPVEPQISPVESQISETQEIEAQETISLFDFNDSPSQEADTSLLKQIDQTLTGFVRPEKVDLETLKPEPPPSAPIPKDSSKWPRKVEEEVSQKFVLPESQKTSDPNLDYQPRTTSSLRTPTLSPTPPQIISTPTSTPQAVVSTPQAVVSIPEKISTQIQEPVINKPSQKILDVLPISIPPESALQKPQELPVTLISEAPTAKTPKSRRFSNWIPFLLALLIFGGIVGYEKALAFLNKPSSKESSFKEKPIGQEKTYLLRAQADLEKEDYSSAWNFIGQALKINPQNLEAIELRAKYYFLKKAYSLAIQDASLILTKDPKASIDMLRIRGFSYYFKNQFLEAIGDLTLLESSPDISLKLAKCYTAMGELEKASNYYMDYLKSNQEDIEVRRENLHLLEKLGHTDSVITEFQKLGQAVPTPLLFKQASKFYQEEKYQEALETLEQILIQTPQHLSALELQSKIYLKQELLEPYIQILSKLIPLQPSALNYKSRGLAYLKQKRYSAAISDFSASLALESQDPQVYYYRGLALENLPDQEKRAIQDYGQALRENPQFAEALLRRVPLLEKQENWTGALQDYSQLIQIQPDGKYYFARGNLYRRLRDSEKTLADYQQAIQMSPENLRYYHQRASFYFSLNRYTEAIQDWNYILAQDPSQSSSLEKLIRKAEEKRREESH